MTEKGGEWIKLVEKMVMCVYLGVIIIVRLARAKFNHFCRKDTSAEKSERQKLLSKG